MDLLAQVLANGILLGGLYAVMALGLALVWGVLNIVNLAHGSFIMLGAYCSWHLFHYLHVDPFLGLPIGFTVGLLASEYARVRNLREAASTSWAALKSVGLGMLVELSLALAAATTLLIGVFTHLVP